MPRGEPGQRQSRAAKEDQAINDSRLQARRRRREVGLAWPKKGVWMSGRASPLLGWAMGHTQTALACQAQPPATAFTAAPGPPAVDPLKGRPERPAHKATIASPPHPPFYH